MSSSDISNPTPEERQLAIREMREEIVAQQGPDFADIERRQEIFDIARESDDLNKGLVGLRNEGLDTFDLSWLELSEGDFSGFKGDRLRADKLVFTLANFREAQLRGANFDAAVGTRADLTKANLDATNWNSAVLTGANFTDVTAKGASFVEAVLNGVDFTGADLRGARFIGTHMIGVKGLEKARTEGAIFRGARILSAEEDSSEPELSSDESALRGALLTQLLTAPSERVESVLDRAKVRGLVLGSSILRVTGVEVSGLLLPDVHAEDLQAQGFVFAETDFTGSDFTGANFDEAIGTNAKLRAVKISGTSFKGAILSGHTDMVEAWAAGADFTDADLSGANVTGANFAGAIFDRTNLEGVIGLDKAIIGGAVFRNVYRDKSLTSSNLPQLNTGNN